MSWVYRQDYHEDGDIAAPGPWLANMREYAGEFNGGLDHDNIPEGAVDADRIATFAFSRVYSDDYASGAADATVSADSLDWQDGTGNELGSVEFYAPVDGTLEVEWGGMWEASTGSTLDCLRFRIIVNGVEIASSGLLNEVRNKDMTYIVGATHISAGKVEVKVQAQTMDVGPSAVDGEGAYTAASQDALVTARELLVTYQKR